MSFLKEGTCSVVEHKTFGNGYSFNITKYLFKWEEYNLLLINFYGSESLLPIYTHLCYLMIFYYHKKMYRYNIKMHFYLKGSFQIKMHNNVYLKYNIKLTSLYYKEYIYLP